MSVEASASFSHDQSTSENNDASMDAAMGAVWDKHEVNNGADRGDDGRFASSRQEEAAQPNPTQEATTEPLEGGEGEGQPGGETSTPPSDVPLPSSWRGLEDTWAKIPPELRESIASHQTKIHKTLSEQGQALSYYKPIGDVLFQFKEYFGGERGNYKPEEAIGELLTLNRQMEDNPVETLLLVADRFGARDGLIKALTGSAAAPGDGGTQQPTDNTNALLAEISQLKRTIQEISDPQRIDARISQKLESERSLSEADQVISRNRKDMPLYDQISEDEMVHYIQRSWKALGETASHDAVLKRAYDMAVNADPDLRAKAAALQGAAVPDPKLVADAKRANATNLRSTSTGKPRELTEDELLGAVFDKHKRA